MRTRTRSTIDGAMQRPRTYVTDLTDLLDEGGRVVEGPAGKMARYLGLIVELGSVMAIGDGGTVSMPCSNPTRRKVCGALIAIGRSSGESIEWSCRRCGESGVIRNWSGSCFDIGRSRAMQPGPYTVNAVVRTTEVWAMRRLGGGVPALRRLLVEAVDFHDGYTMFTADHAELEALRDLAHEAATLARGPDRRLLDCFAARVDAFRTTLPDFIEPGAPSIDLAAAEDAGTPPEVIAIARELAAERGREQIEIEDLIDAKAAHQGGRRPMLH
jgi:hypothetical protein